MKVKCIKNPAWSPDMSSIENTWDHVDRMVLTQDRCFIKTKTSAIHREWNRIPRETCLKLVESMPKRIKESYSTIKDAQLTIDH